MHICGSLSISSVQIASCEFVCSCAPDLGLPHSIFFPCIFLFRARARAHWHSHFLYETHKYTDTLEIIIDLPIGFPINNVISPTHLPQQLQLQSDDDNCFCYSKK